MLIQPLIAIGFLGIALATHSADLNGDGVVNKTDLNFVIAQWGGPGGTPNADLNHSGLVEVGDAGILFSSWGSVGGDPGSTYGLTSDLGVPTGTASDVSDAIATALQTIPKPATVLLEGTYRIDHTVLISGQTGLTIKSAAGVSGGFIRLTQNLEPDTWPFRTPWYKYIMVRDSSNILLENFAITGPLTTPVFIVDFEGAAGLQVAGASTNVTARGLTIGGIHGDFITVSEHGGNHPTGILIENVTGNVAGRQMIAPVGGRGLTVRKSVFRNAKRSGVDVEPSNAGGTENVLIEDTRFEDYGFYCLAGGTTRPHKNITFRRVTCVGGSGPLKYGVPGSTTSHIGLTLEDFVYNWHGSDPESQRGKVSVNDVQDIKIIRADWLLGTGNPGTIIGTGEIRDSIFRSDNSSPPNPVICASSGITLSNNTGAGTCP